VYNAQNYWVSRFCPSSGILNTRGHSVSEAESVSILKGWNHLLCWVSKLADETAVFSYLSLVHAPVYLCDVLVFLMIFEYLYVYLLWCWLVRHIISCYESVLSWVCSVLCKLVELLSS
jgi:hypothetical protein